MISWKHLYNSTFKEKPNFITIPAISTTITLGLLNRLFQGPKRELSPLHPATALVELTAEALSSLLDVNAVFVPDWCPLVMDHLSCLDPVGRVAFRTVQHNPETGLLLITDPAS